MVTSNTAACTTPGVTVIIPYGGDDPHRLGNLRAVVDFYLTEFPSWKMLLCWQDGARQKNQPEFGRRVTTLHVRPSSRFNKSRCINAGARQAQTGILLVADADVILSETDVNRAANAVADTLDVARPFQSIVDMTQGETEIYLDSGRLPGADTATNGIDRRHVGEQLCLAGGAFLIRRPFFLDLGGFDERFSGWGGEDDAFSFMAESASSKTVVSRGAFAWHLWHPRSRNMHDAQYAANIKRLNKIRDLDAADRNDLAQTNRRRLQHNR